MMHGPIDVRYFGVWIDSALQKEQFILYSDWAAGWKIRGSIHDRGKILFSFISKTIAPALRPTQTLTNGHRTCNFTSYLQLAPSLRKRGALPLLSPPLYAFVACTGTTLHFACETHPMNLTLKYQRYCFLTGCLFITFSKPPHNDL